MEHSRLDPFMNKCHELRSLINASSAGRFPKVISVVSTLKGEGKTTIAVCLGLSLARSGRRVAVIELDFRSGGLKGLTGLPPSAGIADVVSGKAELNTVLVEFSELRVINGGTSGMGDPLEVIESPRFKEILETLKKDFDVLILDTPSLNDYTDGVVIARYSDYAVFVVAAGVAPREMVKESIGRLGGLPVGIVLNREQ